MKKVKRFRILWHGKFPIAVLAVPKVFKLGFEDLALGFFILSSKESINNMGRMAHEMTHLAQQASTLWVGYFFGWIFSRQFRMEVEVEGYAVEIMKGGCTLNQAAYWLANHYWLKIDQNIAARMLQEELGFHGHLIPIEFPPS